MKSDIFVFLDVFFSLGMWKVVTQFANTPQKKFTADFEVKEYGKIGVRNMNVV